MSEDKDKTIEQLKSLLENENVSNTIKSIINMMDKKEASKEKTNDKSTNANDEDEKVISFEEEDKPVSNKNSKINTMENMDMMIKIKKIYEKINDRDDPRTNLLLALKPYLSSQRRAHIDNAIKVVNITKLSSLINELD